MEGDHLNEQVGNFLNENMENIDKWIKGDKNNKVIIIVISFNSHLIHLQYD